MPATKTLLPPFTSPRRPLTVLRIVVAAAMVCATAPPARADRLEDDLDTVWEATWDQRGTPRRLARWTQAIRYRFTGSDASRHRETSLAALNAAAQATGVQVQEAATDETPNFVFDIGRQDSLADSVGCEVQPQYDQRSAIREVKLLMRGNQAWNCVHHEVMHAMGVPGHPSGKTVLSYFPSRRDVLMDMDRLMLAAWYDRELTNGASVLEILWSASRHVVQAHTAHGGDAGVAGQRRQAYFDQRIADMKAFATGQGDVPTIIRRSGRASTTHIEAARVAMTAQLGRAYQRGTGVTRDAAQAVHWYRLGAQRAYHPSQVLLARALMRGEGAAVDLVDAHRWMAAAQHAGNAVAAKELADIEKRMDAATIERARALGAHAPAAQQATEPADTVGPR